MSDEVQELPDWLNVSRETLAKLQELWALVRRWNPTINLVSASSLDLGWTRHVLDSAQLWEVAGVKKGLWLDIGSGGGFPGLVIAVIAREQAPKMQVTLVESDRRKCVFLSEAKRQLGLETNVRNGRIEALEAIGASVVSARALAPLDSLLQNTLRQIAPSGVALFPKGQSFEAELRAAKEHWRFDCEVIKSRTDPLAVVLRVENIKHV